MDSDSSESSTVPQVKPKQKRPAPAKALEALAKARQVRFEKKVAAMEAKKAEKEKMAQAVAVCTLPKEEPPVAAPAPVTAPPAQAPAAPDPLAELTKRLDALLTATPPKPVKKTARIRKPVESSSSEEEVVVRKKKKAVQRDPDYLAYKAAQIQQQLERDERNRLKNLFLR